MFRITQNLFSLFDKMILFNNNGSNTKSSCRLNLKNIVFDICNLETIDERRLDIKTDLPRNVANPKVLGV